MLVIEIDDDGPGPPDAIESGHGLDNTRLRLAAALRPGGGDRGHASAGRRRDRARDPSCRLMTPLRVLIVDDEPLARRRLRTLLKDEPEFEVVGECEDGPSAVADARRLAPDLMLLDVQMPGMDGFDVMEALGPSRCPVVVFVTAYDEYAMKAFDVHAVDYLLKPFDRKRLRHALARARALRLHDEEPARRLMAVLAEIRAGRPQDRIVVKARGRVYFVLAPRTSTGSRRPVTI